MTGLALAQFMKHGGDTGGSGKWLRRWNKDGVGEITIWLHTRAPIVPCFSHTFMLEDEYEDKETGRMVPGLRYPRFVSLDAEIVHKNQHFRNDDGSLQVPPDRDPFLLLREWLRFAEHIALDQPIFRWNDEKNRKTIIWDRGELSGKVKRGQANFSHSLDTKQEYIYVVVDNENIANGPVLDREGKLLSKKIVDVIKLEQKLKGEEGDPHKHPYAFLLVAQKSKSPMDSYNAHRDDRAAFTDEVWEQIGSQDFPDPLPHGEPSEGDEEKIKDAFAAAMQIDLPLDAIFSEDADERRALTKPAAATRAAPRASRASQTRSTAQQPPPPTREPKPETGAQAAQTPPAGATAAGATGGPQARRKKVDKPAEPPPPPAELIPCEDCGTPMLPTESKCAKCGAEYEVDEAPAPQTKPSGAGPKPSGAGPKPTSTAGPKPGSAGPKPGAAQQELPQTTSASSGEARGDCWSCGTELDDNTVCPSCGIDQGDDLPF